MPFVSKQVFQVFGLPEAVLQGEVVQNGAINNDGFPERAPLRGPAQPGAASTPGMPKIGLAWGPRAVPHGYRCARISTPGRLRKE